MKKMTIAALAATALMCLATPAFAQDTTAAPPAAAEATAPAADQTAPPEAAAAPADAAAPAEDPGHIIFFRPSRLSGGIYTYHVRETAEDGNVTDASPLIGDLPNGRFFRYDAPAGIHNYNIAGPMAFNRDQDRLRIEIEPGETYYVEMTERMGLITAGFMLVPSSEAEFTRRHMREAAPPRQH